MVISYLSWTAIEQFLTREAIPPRKPVNTRLSFRTERTHPLRPAATATASSLLIVSDTSGLQARWQTESNSARQLPFPRTDDGRFTRLSTAVGVSFTAGSLLPTVAPMI